MGLVGWLLRRKDRAPKCDAETRIEPGLAPEPLASIAPDPAEMDIIAGVGGRRLGYDEAARAFVAWLQARGETGEITRKRLFGLYARHCEDAGLAWLPEGRFFAALGRIAERHERRIPRGDGIRQRMTTYDIPGPGQPVPEVAPPVARRPGRDKPKIVRVA